MMSGSQDSGSEDDILHHYGRLLEKDSRDDRALLDGSTPEARKRRIRRTGSSVYSRQRQPTKLCSSNCLAVGFGMMGMTSLLVTALILVTFILKDTSLSGATIASNHAPHLEANQAPLQAVEGSGEASEEECADFLWKELRLPAAIAPSAYHVRLHPSLSAFTLDGTSTVTAAVLAPTHNIILHYKHLQVDLVGDSVTSKLGDKVSKIKVEKFSTCASMEQIAIELASPLPKGATVKFSFKFNGNITSNYEGLYKTGYTTKDKTVYSAVTQFEPVSARAVFPCFDEPEMKATFEVSVVREKTDTVLANMNLRRTVPLKSDPSLVEDHFAPSVKMSTYLVAVAILRDFGKISNHTSRGNSSVKLSVYAPKQLVQDTEFALEVGVKALECLEEFFNIPFPLPKEDLVAVSEFEAGAMENWGLITFRDTALLYNPNVSTTASKQWVAIVIVHELAHQWFGNLVTMKWWNDLWLNEGFATWIEYFATSKIMPEWHIMDSFYLDTISRALYIDGQATSHPISVTVEDPAQIGSIFDTISYKKGAAIINMFMELAGEEKFREGLQEYLNHYKYRNAEGKDLWAILGKHMPNLKGMGLEEVAKDWTTQVGYPVVTLRLDSTKQLLHYNQSRFMYLHHKKQTKGQWRIPLSYRTDFDPAVKQEWITEKTGTLNFTRKVGWIRANLNGVGPFRVLYDRDVYRELGLQLQKDHKIFNAADRASLIYDAFSFMKAGLLDLPCVMDLLKYVEMGKERERAPLMIIMGQLTGIGEMIFDTDLHPLFKKYMKHLISPLYSKNVWNLSSDTVERLTQLYILGMACGNEVEDCVEEAKRVFKDWQNNKHVEVDLKPLAIATGVKYGKLTEWNFIFNKYKESGQPSEQTMLLGSLAASRDPWILQRYLRKCLDRKLIKPSVITTPIGGVASNPVGKLMAWRFVRKNWKKITKSVGLSSILGRIIKRVLQDFSTEFDLKDVKGFFTGMKLNKAQKRLEEALESIEIQIQWRKLNEKPLNTWLEVWNSKLAV